MSEQTMTQEPPIFKAVNGEVLWRGTWLPKDNAEALWSLYDNIAKAPDDYAHAMSAVLRDQLGDVMAEAYHQAGEEN